MTDSQTLLDQAKCYMCLGVTLAEALELALLAQIAGGGAGFTLGAWVQPTFPPPGSQGTVGQEIPLDWTNTTGKIQWFQCSVALFSGGGTPSVCDFIVNSPTHPAYSPQTVSGDEEDFFFSVILAPGEKVTTVFDAVADNGHRVQTVWYRTLN